jgi:hypothetical protein
VRVTTLIKNGEEKERKWKKTKKVITKKKNMKR